MVSRTAFTASAPLTGSTSASASYVGSISGERSPGLTVATPMRRCRFTMAAPAVIERKTAIIDSVKSRLDSAQMIFSVSLPGLTVANVADLRHALPEGSSAMAVKNTLMRRAIAETGWEVAGPMLKESGIWVFVDEDIKGSIEAYKKIAKDLDREPIQGGVLDNTLYDEAGIKAIAALPSKLELITKIARAVNAVPTKLAVSINQVPTKVARSIKLAFADEPKAEE